MILKLIIHYFQNYKETVIELHPRLNVFLGSSDQGKSVITKVINWVRKNSPSGIGFKNRKFPNKDTIGGIVTPEGTVKRVRGKKNNYYKINEESPLKALNKKVPPEVSKLLNIEDINVHSQFDGFFLLQDSPAVVAKKFNEFVGLELIDKISKESEKKVRQYNKESLQHEENIKAVEKKLKKYKNLPLVKSLLAKAQKLDSETLGIQLDLEKVEVSVFSLRTLQKASAKLPDLTVIKNLFKKVYILKEEIKSEEEKIQRVEGLLKVNRGFQVQKRNLKNIPEITKLMKEIKKRYNTFMHDSETLTVVQDIFDSYVELKTSQNDIAQELSDYEAHRKHIYTNIKICPTCKQKWRN